MTKKNFYSNTNTGIGPWFRVHTKDLQLPIKTSDISNWFESQIDP